MPLLPPNPGDATDHTSFSFLAQKIPVSEIFPYIGLDQDHWHLTQASSAALKIELTIVSIFNQWIQAWLRVRMLWHSTSNFSGYIPDFGRLLSRLESGCLLKCHNRAPYAYVITVPYFVYQCLILLLTGYIALTVMCNHTLILLQPKAAWSATLMKHTKCFILTWSTQMVKPDTIPPLRQPYVWTIHTTTV